MNYTVPLIKIKSSWFDHYERKENVYQKITYKGLYLYFTLYKFRLHGQEEQHTFITSIGMLRKETGYSANEIFELLKKMKRAKIIKLDNVSRWDYLLDEDGNVKDKDVLVIYATDTFDIFKQHEIMNDDDYYLYIPFEMFNRYLEAGLNEKYFALFCLFNKWNNNNEGKMYMAIDKIASQLGFDKDYVNKMIYNLNRNYLLSSYRRRRKGKQGFKFEHYLLMRLDDESVEKFLKVHKDNMDKLVSRIDNRKNKKKAIDIESVAETLPELEEVEEEKVAVKEEVKLAFGVEGGKSNKKEWVNPEPEVNYDDDYWERVFG